MAVCAAKQRSHGWKTNTADALSGFWPQESWRNTFLLSPLSVFFMMALANEYTPYTQNSSPKLIQRRRTMTLSGIMNSIHCAYNLQSIFLSTISCVPREQFHLMELRLRGEPSFARWQTNCGTEPLWFSHRQELLLKSMDQYPHSWCLTERKAWGPCSWMPKRSSLLGTEGSPQMWPCHIPTAPWEKGMHVSSGSPQGFWTLFPSLPRRCQLPLDFREDSN